MKLTVFLFWSSLAGVSWCGWAATNLVYNSMKYTHQGLPVHDFTLLILEHRVLYPACSLFWLAWGLWLSKKRELSSEQTMIFAGTCLLAMTVIAGSALIACLIPYTTHGNPFIE